MGVGSAGNNPVAVFFESSCKSGGIFKDLFLQQFKFRGHCQLETHSLGGQQIERGGSLGTGEYGGADLFGLFPPAQNNSPAAALKGFIGCKGHKIGMGNRPGNHFGGHQAGDVGHIHQQISRNA